MTTLFLDFASHRQQFALVDETKILGNAVISDHKAEEALMPTLEKLLQDQKIDFKALTHIACVTGPGGFTSLRVGVSMANALSFGLKIPIADIHLSDLWSEVAKKKEKDFLWLHSTRKTAVFVRGFGSFEKKWPEPVLIDITDLKAQMKSGTKVIGELIPEHQETLKDIISMIEAESFDDVLPETLSKLSYQKEPPILPWYGREA